MKKITTYKNSPVLGFVLRIELQDVRQEIWRRLVVPANTSLEKLHLMIQISMGWQDSHMHQYHYNHQCYLQSTPFDDDEEQNGTLKEADYSLDDFFTEIPCGFIYEYDFGDSWCHRITFENVILASTADKTLFLPHAYLLDGKNACPPEDCGGAPGFEHLLEVINDPTHEEYEEMIDWLGKKYHPEKWNSKAANKKLAALA